LGAGHLVVEDPEGPAGVEAGDLVAHPAQRAGRQCGARPALDGVRGPFGEVPALLVGEGPAGFPAVPVLGGLGGRGGRPVRRLASGGTGESRKSHAPPLPGAPPRNRSPPPAPIPVTADRPHRGRSTGSGAAAPAERSDGAAAPRPA